MGSHVILTEFQPEALFFSGRADLLTTDTKIVSLLPESSVFWKKEGMAFETSVPYFPKASHERCLVYVDKVIRRINTLASIQDAAELRHAYVNALTFYLRQYLSYVASTIETVENILDAHSADRLHVAVYNGNDYSQYALVAKERILGEIVQKFEGRIKVVTYPLDVPAQIKPNGLKQKARSLFCRGMFAWELHEIKKRRPHNALLFYSMKFNLDHVARNLQAFEHYNLVPNKTTFTKTADDSCGVRVSQIHLSDAGRCDDVFQTSLEKSLEALYVANRQENLFVYRGIDFSDIIFRKFEKGYIPQLKRLNRQAFSIGRLLKVLKPQAVVAPMARDVSYALGEMCSLLNIPSALISHGSHVPPQNDFDRLEWMDHAKGLIHTDYRYHLLQTPWAVEHVRAMGYHGQYHCVEPLIFPTVSRVNKDTQQLKMFPKSQGRKILVHAGTPKPRGSNRLYIYETLDEYIQYIEDLIEATRQLPDVFLVVRFRPYPYLSVDQLQALLQPGDHYTIASHGSFADYLKIADLMISFSSTTIEEALINRIPVLQYDASNRYIHIDGARWADKGFAHVDSVYYIGDRAFLRPGIEWIVRHHLNETTVGDLFERHVFNSDDDAIRVEEFIERLVKGDLPAPIVLNEKKHLNLGDMF